MTGFEAPTLTRSGFTPVEWHAMSDSSVVPLRLRSLPSFLSVWAARTQGAFALWITDWLIRMYRSDALRVTHTCVHYEELEVHVEDGEGERSRRNDEEEIDHRTGKKGRETTKWAAGCKFVRRGEGTAVELPILVCRPCRYGRWGGRRWDREDTEHEGHGNGYGKEMRLAYVCIRTYIYIVFI